jgi:hypothetical protein
MNTTKIIIALVAVAALTLVVVGLASAQIEANQPYNNTASKTATPYGGFFGWLGSCFSFRAAQPYYDSTPYIAPQVPTNSSVPAPYQGYYGYGYGYGPCWAR